MCEVVNPIISHICRALNGGKSSQDGIPGALGLTGYLLFLRSLGQRPHDPRAWRASAGLYWASFAGHCFTARENWPLKAPPCFPEVKEERGGASLFGPSCVPLTPAGGQAPVFTPQSTLYHLLILQRKKPTRTH